MEMKKLHQAKGKKLAEEGVIIRLDEEYDGVLLEISRVP